VTLVAVVRKYGENVAAEIDLVRGESADGCACSE
jgi:hypothetical protein